MSTISNLSNAQPSEPIQSSINFEHSNDKAKAKPQLRKNFDLESERVNKFITPVQMSQEPRD